MKRFAKTALEQSRQMRLRMLKQQEARNALRVLADHGEISSAAVKRLAREDAQERLGNVRHALWLELYATVSGSYRDGWLPDSYYLEEVMPRVNGISHHLAWHGATNALFFDHPALPDVLYTLNGRLLGQDYKALTLRQAQERISGLVVFKADRSGFGKGIQTFDFADLDEARLRELGNGLLQPVIQPHEAFGRFGVTSLATLRLGTVLPLTGPPEIRCCYLKIGRSGQQNVVAHNQVRVAVNWTSGAAEPRGYLSNWQPTDVHPDTQAALKGFEVPGIAQAAGLVRDLHSRLPLPRFVCWDLAIDQDENVRLLEWEGGVVSFAEPTQGPCFTGLGWDRLHLSASVAQKDKTGEQDRTSTTAGEVQRCEASRTGRQRAGDERG